jgi:flagellar hook-basal body complex protein FliE
MSLPISSVRFPSNLTGVQPLAKPGSTAAGFRSVLAEAVGQVEAFHNNSQAAIGKFLSGEDEEIHKVALATQQAEIAFDLFVQVRNKVVSAYQEIMRMQM